MNFLLDTHALLWSLAEPEKLGDRARVLLSDPANTVIVSVASYWESSIKYQLGKLPLPNLPRILFPPYVEAMGFQTLSIAPEHGLAVGELPQHHRDPFDRMLVVQAMLERLTLITADPVFERYGIQVIRADR